MTAADRQRYPSHDGGAVPTDIWHAMSGSGGGVPEGRAWEQVGGAVVGVGVRVAGGHLKRQHQRRVRHDADALPAAAVSQHERTGGRYRSGDRDSGSLQRYPSDRSGVS